MKKRKQLLQAKLHGHRLKHWRINAEGKRIGKVDKWEIGGGKYAASSLPRAMFFLMWSFVMRRIKQCDDKEFGSRKKAILRALCEAAEASGCTHEFGAEKGDIAWYLDGKPFITFQIHQEYFHTFRLKKILRSRAVARFAIKLSKSGYARYKACKVRK
jgi:hypothetical protein